eukprot:CAMPEP_0173259812 /NCGR_PEP_ID=MMETSP1142-20121109/25216_1 /TAXON_ID=483371 /ORGANISM="non described non described, Strain CCMP2298" /LENGTH=44 /DNA_ID= /DNA_START= /DNA_END= /DNA_ORIENTATION=
MPPPSNHMARACAGDSMSTRHNLPVEFKPTCPGMPLRARFTTGP